MPPLQPCPSCRRHIRVTERSCPFCKAKGFGLAGGALLAAALSAGCPSQEPPRGMAEYGMPPPPPATASPGQSPAPSPGATPSPVATPDPEPRAVPEYGMPMPPPEEPVEPAPSPEGR